MKSSQITKLLFKIFTTSAVEKMVIELLGEIVKRTHNQLDDRIYEIVLKSRDGRD